ncbi:hypothetical protein ACO2Q8_08195 [Larkinella sp. VNQ87]|uniref:hypothetical protein n=1 Tax=Larkinella sp. VNQ87 TaxID=3400921 RepID=UPI003C023A0A
MNVMINIFDQKIAGAAKAIQQASDRDLSLPNYNEKVFDRFKVMSPKLSLEQTKVQIKKESISFRNAPPGISFSISGNTIVECAIYSIPVFGDVDLFEIYIKPYIDRQMTYFENKTLFYREYSNTQITGNDELIAEIKKHVIQFTDNVNNILAQCENEVNEFHNSRLKPRIDEMIRLEIDRRNLKSNSEAKLNPFL